jgi:hypothetical protein
MLLLQIDRVELVDRQIAGGRVLELQHALPERGLANLDHLQRYVIAISNRKKTIIITFTITNSNSNYNIFSFYSNNSNSNYNKT